MRGLLPALGPQDHEEIQRKGHQDRRQEAPKALRALVRLAAIGRGGFSLRE